MQPEQIKQEVSEQIAAIKVRIWSTPRLYLYLAGVIVICIMGYILWLKFGTQPAEPGSVVISAQPAKEIAKMETKVIYVPQIVVIKEKAEAVAKLGLPASEAINPKEALLTATGIATNRYGAVSAVFLNTSTGKSRVDVVYKDAPWFSLQRGNTVGIEAGYGMKGKYVQADMEHEFAQVKGNFIAVKGSGTFYETTTKDNNPSDFRVGMRLQRHFDWP